MRSRLDIPSGVCLLLLGLSLLMAGPAGGSRPAVGGERNEEKKGALSPKGDSDPDEAVFPEELRVHVDAERKLSLLWELAQAYQEAGDYDKALDSGRAIVSMTLPRTRWEPPAPGVLTAQMAVYQFMAETLERKKDPEGALRVVDEGVARFGALEDLPNPKRTELLVSLLKVGGRISRRSGNPKRAATYLERAVELLK